MKIRIRWESGQVAPVLKDTPTSRQLAAVLPLESKANTWGQEVYSEISVVADLETNAKRVIDPRTVCFWVKEKSLAIAFESTPVSNGDECRLVTRVNILGSVEGNPSTLASIRAGDLIRVEALAS